MEKINISGAIPPAGHYTPAIKSGDMIYVSGQLPIDPYTGEKCFGNIKEQALRSLLNIKLILESAGSSIEKIVKINIYVSDISQWNNVNEVYADFFGSHKPARIVVPTRNLHYGFLVEIDAVAEAGE